MTFVFDECLSDRIPKALSMMGEPACSWKDKWPASTPDSEWIPMAAARGWCVVTADYLRPHERLALRQNRGRVFLVAVKNLRIWHQFRLIVNKWENVKRAAQRRKPPYVIRVPKRGKLQDIVL
jgi:predicted nuclease of predicted toxin-antitoxin system